MFLKDSASLCAILTSQFCSETLFLGYFDFAA